MSDTKPEKPTSDNITPTDWVDYPDNSGQWWQCIGTVNGATNKVMMWSDVLPVNGQDGIAQDGKHVEMRFSLSDSSLTPPTIINSDRIPEG